MEDRRRTYTDPATGELVFLEWSTQHDGWIPAMATIEGWQRGDVRIYQPTDRPSMMITMPDHIYWPRLRPNEEADIRVLLARPWIPDGQANENLIDLDIDVIDAIHRIMTDTTDADLDWVPPAEDATGHLDLDAILRPTLTLEMPLTFVLIPRPTPVALALTLALALPKPFPRHLVDQVLEKAETDGQACPITMEPIKKATATVTSCGHIFQKAAIAEWLTTSDTCPECRQPIII